MSLRRERKGPKLSLTLPPPPPEDLEEEDNIDGRCFISGYAAAAIEGIKKELQTDRAKSGMPALTESMIGLSPEQKKENVAISMGTGAAVIIVGAAAGIRQRRTECKERSQVKKLPSRLQPPPPSPPSQPLAKQKVSRPLHKKKTTRTITTPRQVKSGTSRAPSVALPTSSSSSFSPLFARMMESPHIGGVRTATTFGFDGPSVPASSENVYISHTGQHMWIKPNGMHVPIAGTPPPGLTETLRDERKTPVPHPANTHLSITFGGPMTPLMQQALSYPLGELPKGAVGWHMEENGGRVTTTAKYY